MTNYTSYNYLAVTRSCKYNYSKQKQKDAMQTREKKDLFNVLVENRRNNEN